MKVFNKIAVFSHNFTIVYFFFINLTTPPIDFFNFLTPPPRNDRPPPPPDILSRYMYGDKFTFVLNRIYNIGYGIFTLVNFNKPNIS